MQLQRQCKPPAGVFCGLTLVLALLLSATAYSSITLVPTDLNPGDTYHLAFVTSTTRDATSSNIADYDAFRQPRTGRAGGGLENISWKVTGSTATVNAIDHIGVLGPVYRLDNPRIANDETDLFDGTLAAPPTYAYGIGSNPYQSIFRFLRFLGIDSDSDLMMLGVNDDDFTDT